MLTAITAIVAFLTSFAPSIIQLFTAKENNAQQLKLANLNLEAQRQQLDGQLAVANAQADIQQQQSLYSYDAAATGNKLVDALRGIVRPYITLILFHMWIAVEASLLYYGIQRELPLDQIVHVVWSEETSSMLAAVIAFWFGRRAAQYGNSAARAFQATPAATVAGKPPAAKPKLSDPAIDRHAPQ
jgi:hypothetical protein